MVLVVRPACWLSSAKTSSLKSTSPQFLKTMLPILKLMGNRYSTSFVSTNFSISRTLGEICQIYDQFSFPVCSGYHATIIHINKLYLPLGWKLHFSQWQLNEIDSFSCIYNDESTCYIVICTCTWIQSCFVATPIYCNIDIETFQWKLDVS